MVGVSVGGMDVAANSGVCVAVGGRPVAVVGRFVSVGETGVADGGSGSVFPHPASKVSIKIAAMAVIV